MSTFESLVVLCAQNFELHILLFVVKRKENECEKTYS